MADNLSCPLCYELFTNVVETPCCSQGFCLACLDSALKATRQTCPNCRKPLSIFSCVPNKMVQRMVDNTPAECIYPGCIAKITRGIKKDHIEKCPNKPKVVGSPCPTHNLPLAFVCEEDKEAICSLCNIVGKHRTHKMGIKTEGENSIFLKGIKNIGILSVEADMQTNLASFPYILANGIADIGILDKVVNHDVKVSNSNSNSNGGKEEMRAISPILREHKIVSTAAFMLLLKNASLTTSNINEMLKLAGIDSLSDNQYPKLLETYESKVKQWLQVTQEESKSEKFNKLVNETIDEKAAEKEFEQLKEKYHNEQFNFQGVQIKALPLCSKLLPNVPNHVYVLLEIRVGKKEEKKEDKRPPFSLSIVLDRSGSMAGSKIEMAKQAIQNLVDKLESEDRFHLIQYDDRSEVVFTDGTIFEKQRLKQLISQCRAEGGTNISGGLQTGFDVVMKSEIPTKKIFLFSDGQAGSGITSKPEMNKFVQGLWEKGVGISTFGIGSDYDELMMKGIAENSKGHYFYVDSPHTIDKLLDKAFKGLARTVASNVVLKVKGGKGRIVTKVKESSNREIDDLFKGIVLGDMREKDIKQVLVQIEVNEKESADPIEVLSFELSYEKLDDFVQDSPVSGSVTLTTTTNLDELNTFNDEAQVYLTIHECGELDKKVLKFLEQNLLESAIETKLEVIDALNSVANKDKVGFVKVLLMKAKRSLKDLVNLFVSRNRAQASSYGITASASAKSYDHIKKEQHKALEDEADEDMGFALFD